MKKRIFSFHDIVLLSGEKEPTVSVQLSRLVKSAIVERPIRGWYVNPFAPPSAEEFAMVIRRPSYLSLEYALSRHGVLSQNVFTITSITTKQPYTYQTRDQIFEYHQIKSSLFWGYTMEGAVIVAEPEKALLDLIYIRFVRGKDMKRSSLDSMLDDMYLDELDRRKILRYAKGFDRMTAEIISETNT